MRPTAEQEAAHYRTGVGALCLVCDLPLRTLATDYHGQGRCQECGTTYQLLGCHLTAEALAEMGLAKEDVARRYCDCFELVPLLRAYHQETRRKAPLGCYLGESPIPWDDVESFYRWLALNAIRFRPDHEDEFRWDAVLAEFGHYRHEGEGI